MGTKHKINLHNYAPMYWTHKGEKPGGVERLTGRTQNKEGATRGC